MSTGHFAHQMGQLLKARYPLVYVQTFEELRAHEVLAAVATDPGAVRTPRVVVTWSLSEGLSDLPEHPAPRDSRDPLVALAHLRGISVPSIVIMRDLHHYLGAGVTVDAHVIRHLRDVANTFQRGTTPRTLVLVSPVLAVPVDLEKDVTVLELPLPDESSLREMLTDLIASNAEHGRITIDVDDAGIDRLVSAARGLTRHEAENAFARAMVDDGRLSTADVGTIHAEKRQAIRKSGLLEDIVVSNDLDAVGGLENLKRWLNRRGGSWTTEARAYGIPSPQGVLITGVPGCGKSLTAKAVATSWGLPLIKLDVGRIFSSLVGSSEHNIREAIRVAEATAPCVLWIDEIDKGLSGAESAGDSGTTSRVYSTFLSWLQEKSSSVFVIATANNIESLPSELLRKGRFDEIFFVDLPTHAERRKIWQIHLERRTAGLPAGEGLTIGDTLLEGLAELSTGYSGAEIEQCVASALIDAYEERRPVRADDLDQAVVNLIPLSTTQSEHVAALRAWADTRAVAATALHDRSDQDSPGPAPRPDDPDTRHGRHVDF